MHSITHSVMILILCNIYNNDKNNKIIRKERNTSTHYMRNGGILPRNLRSKEILRETNILDSVAMLENLEK